MYLNLLNSQCKATVYQIMTNVPGLSLKQKMWLYSSITKHCTGLVCMYSSCLSVSWDQEKFDRNSYNFVIIASVENLFRADIFFQSNGVIDLYVNLQFAKRNHLAFIRLV